MALSVTHAFNVAIADDPKASAAGEVLPSHWNANHSLNGALDLTSQTTGTLPIASGGTNATSFTSGTITYASTTALASAAGTNWDNTNQALTIAGASLSSSTVGGVPVLNLSQTWNNANVTFTGFVLNVTNTASKSGSLLQDLQSGGVSVWSVDGSVASPVTGLRFVPGSSSNCTLQIIQSSLQGSANFIIQPNTSNSPNVAFKVQNQPGNNSFEADVPADVTQGASFNCQSGNGLLSFKGSKVICSPTNNAAEQRNGTSAQALRVFNTFTDDSNYERFAIDWTGVANLCILDTQAAGTGTQRNLSLRHIDATTTGTSTTVTLASSTCPAATPTAVFTWLKMVSADGSTVYVPAWK